MHTHTHTRTASAHSLVQYECNCTPSPVAGIRRPHCHCIDNNAWASSTTTWSGLRGKYRHNLHYERVIRIACAYVFAQRYLYYFFRFRRRLVNDKATDENHLCARVSLFTWRDDFFLSVRPFCSIQIDMINDIAIRWAIFITISWAATAESIQNGFTGNWIERYGHKSIQYFLALERAEKLVANKVHSIVSFNIIIQPFKFYLNIQSAFNGTKFNGSQLI